MHLLRYIIICCGLSVSAFYSVTASADTVGSWPKLSAEEKIYGLSMFWKEASYNFAFFDQVPDLDWDSAYTAFIPQVSETENVYQYYRTLERFCGLLHDGHTRIMYPQYLWDSVSFPKIMLNEYERKPVVVNVDTGLAGRIPIGTEILTVDGIPYVDYLDQQVFPYLAVSAEHILWDEGIKKMLRGRKGTEFTLRVRKPDGVEDQLALTRSREGINWLKPRDTEFHVLDYQRLDGNIAYVAINSFNYDSAVTRFEEILPELYDAAGVVLDLRENHGGKTTIGTAILGHFTDRLLYGGRWRSPQNVGAFRAWGERAFQRGETAAENDRVPYFTGDSWYEGDTWTYQPPAGRKITAPVAVLISRSTGSAAEDFLVFADSLEHFTLFGEPSNGSTGQPLMIRNLPGGGAAQVCAKRDTYPDGRDFVGYGVQPDIPVRQTIEDYLADRDVVLERALTFLRENKQ